MQEWYLLMPDTRPNITGGYENESFIDYKDDAFYEMLQTDIASNVILYNSDLSSSSIIRCVIQGNTADTQLKSMERVGLFSCCLLYTSPSPRDYAASRMPSSA